MIVGLPLALGLLVFIGAIVWAWMTRNRASRRRYEKHWKTRRPR